MKLSVTVLKEYFCFKFVFRFFHTVRIQVINKNATSFFHFSQKKRRNKLFCKGNVLTDHCNEFMVMRIHDFIAFERKDA